MTLWLKISNKTQGSKYFALQDGLTIGRHNCDLTIEDSKVSSKHAKVMQRDEKQLWLVDQGSTNGIKVGQKKLQEIELTVGVRFALGRTEFEVLDHRPNIAVEDAEVFDQKSIEGIEYPHQESRPSSKRKSTQEETKDQPNWQSVLLKMLDRMIRDIPPQKKEIRPFANLVHLEFLVGPQKGTTWTLGYGPRSIGSRSIDLTIIEKDAPAICFRLEPKGDAILFRTEQTDHVKINSKPIESDYLKSGDVITCLTSLIQVTFAPRTNTTADKILDKA